MQNFTNSSKQPKQIPDRSTRQSRQQSLPGRQVLRRRRSVIAHFSFVIDRASVASTGPINFACSCPKHSKSLVRVFVAYYQKAADKKHSESKQVAVRIFRARQTSKFAEQGTLLLSNAVRSSRFTRRESEASGNQNGNQSGNQYSPESGRVRKHPIKHFNTHFCAFSERITVENLTQKPFQAISNTRLNHAGREIASGNVDISCMWPTASVAQRHNVLLFLVSS